jgi:hypothetical protein
MIKLLAQFDIENVGDVELPVEKQELHKFSVDALWERYGGSAGLGNGNEKKQWCSRLGYDGLGKISAAVWREENKVLAATREHTKSVALNSNRPIFQFDDLCDVY